MRAPREIVDAVTTVRAMPVRMRTAVGVVVLAIAFSLACPSSRRDPEEPGPASTPATEDGGSETKSSSP